VAPLERGGVDLQRVIPAAPFSTHSAGATPAAGVGYGWKSSLHDRRAAKKDGLAIAKLADWQRAKTGDRE
jgi:hypothetical protein